MDPLVAVFETVGVDGTGFETARVASPGVDVHWRSLVLLVVCVAAFACVLWLTRAPVTRRQAGGDTHPLPKGGRASTATVPVSTVWMSTP